MWAAANPAGSDCLSQQMEGPLFFFLFTAEICNKTQSTISFDMLLPMFSTYRLSFLMTTKAGDSENPGIGRHPEDQTVGNGDRASGLGLRLE